MSVAVPVSELAEQVRGVTYGKGDASSSPRPGYLPVLRAGNITEGGLTFDDLVFVPAERISEKQKIRRNDVVIAASSGSLDIVGKAARALADYEGGFGAFCKVLRPGPDVDAAYFAHFFRTPQYRQRVSALAAGVNINNLRNEHLDKMQIPFPPLPEQQRIAEILDKSDALRAKRRDALAKLDTLTQSIFLDLFGDPATNPKGWPISTVGDVAEIIVPARDKPKSFSGDVPWLTLPDIVGLYVTDSKNMLSEREAAEVGNRLIPSGSVLLSCAATVGRVAIVHRPAYANQQFYGLVPRQGFVAPEYLALSLRARGNLYFKRLGGSFTISFFSKERTLNIPLALPPMSVQTTLVRAVAAIERLRALQNETARGVDLVFASLQQYAFQGG